MTARARVAAWWRERWTDVAMATYYLGIAAVGLIGINTPSQTLEQTLGLGYAVYGAGMIVLGLLAVYSVVARSRRSEAVCLIAISVLSVVHGALLLTAEGGGGVQTGLRLALSPLGAIVLAYYRREIALTRTELRRQAASADALAAHEEARR